jgi:hypothetical protein
MSIQDNHIDPPTDELWQQVMDHCDDMRLDDILLDLERHGIFKRMTEEQARHEWCELYYDLWKQGEMW